MLIIDIIFGIAILILGFHLKNLYPFSLSEKKLINIIFVYHTVICFIATPIVKFADGYWYWMAPKNLTLDVLLKSVLTNPKPTQLLYLINYFPSKYLDLSYQIGMLSYSVIGFWGIILLLLVVKSFFGNLTTLRDVKLLGIPIYPYIFLLPNMHFWSSGIGKDTLLFFAICLMIYAAVNLQKRWLGLIIGCVIGYFLRPHVLLFLASGFALSFILSLRFNLFQKIIFLAIALIIFIPLLNNVLAFAKIEELSTDHLENFASDKSKVLSKAGSGIDFSTYPYPLKVLTFLFRPLFFDINGIPALIASVENLIQIFLMYFFFRNNFVKFISSSHYIIRGCFFYFVVGALAFAPVMSNLGIIIREKNMLMPAFLIFILASIKYKLITTPTIR